MAMQYIEIKHCYILLSKGWSLYFISTALQQRNKIITNDL